MAIKVLMIDDDTLWCATLSRLLTEMEFQVETASDGITGLKKAYSLQPDVVLLDLMMPGMDGWQMCTRLREICEVPIIMITALGKRENVVKGLDMGADDYMVKPINTEELVARIRAVLRRVAHLNPDAKADKIISEDGLVIDFDKYEVKVHGKRVDLTPTEFKLLAVLTKYKGRVLPHDFLLTEVWGPEYAGEVDYLRLYISYLRNKLEEDASDPEYIYNEWGIGYRFG